MLTETINYLLLLLSLVAVVSSTPITFLFPKPECSSDLSNSQMIIDRMRSRLSYLDKEYKVVLRDDFLEFDYSGGLRNIRLLDECVKEINLSVPKIVVCPAIKDHQLYDRLISGYTLYVTDEIVNVRFSLSSAGGSDFSYISFVFRGFHSSVWSILLLLSLLMGIIVYSLDNIAYTETIRDKGRGISLLDAYFITYFTLWGLTVCKNLKTMPAKIVLYVWQLFILLMLILYVAAVLSLVMKGDFIATSNLDHIVKASKVYCSRKTATLCDRLISDYQNLKIEWQNCNQSYNLTNSVSVVFRSEDPINSPYQFLHNNSLVFVSNNITIIRDINRKMLPNFIKPLRRSHTNAVVRGLPIRLKHIYGPIIFLVIGCALVSFLSLFTVASRITFQKIRKYRERISTKSKRGLRTDEENINGTTTESDSPNHRLNQSQETEV